MIDRLRERADDADPVLARAAELASAVPTLTKSEARKLRVRNAVLASGTGRAWLPLVLRPSLVLALVLAAGVVTAATIGRPFLIRTYHSLRGSDEVPTLGSSVSTKAQPEARTALPGWPEMKLLPAMPEPAAPASPGLAPARPVNSGARASKPASQPTNQPNPTAQLPKETEPAAPSPVKAASAQETTLLMAAVHSLRREHDPLRAGVLLDDYLARYPGGVLAEEALALAIEAASARGDTQAATLAHTYLQRYPHGRFQQAARAAAE
jgi:hypothetical protein